MPIGLGAIAIPAAISGVSSLLGGIFGSRASKDAARIQAEAAERAGQLGIATGEQAAIDAVNAGNEASAGVAFGTEEANRTLRDVRDEARGLTEPFREAGVDALGRLSDLAGEEFKFTQDDPSFKFLMEQGQQALERSAAARGTVVGGRALKEVTRFSQGLASTEYGNAFNRFFQGQNQRAGILSNLAGLGSTATGQQLAAGSEFGGRTSANLTRGSEVQANLRTGAADTAGRFRIAGAGMGVDAITGGANAQAAGRVGSSNAWLNALSGVGGTATNAAQLLLLRDLLKPPQPAPGVPGAS